MRDFASIKPPSWGCNKRSIETSSCGRGPGRRRQKPGPSTAGDPQPAPGDKQAGQGGEQPKPPLQTPSTSATPAPASSSTPSVTFFYRAVLSHTPKTQTRRWTPQGQFQYKTLAELCSELPFDGAATQGLTISVDSACMTMVERIPPDDEDGFESLKRYINTEIRSWFRRQRQNGVSPPRLVFDILIERMGKGERRGVRVEDLELELELDW